MNSKLFWERIKKLAKEKHASYRDIAAAIGMPHNTFKSWISKKVIPSLDYTIGLSEYFNVSIEFLVFGKGACLHARIKNAEILLRKISRELRIIRRSAA